MKLKTLALVLALLSTSAFAAPVDVKLLTWNVYMLPKPIKWSKQGDRKKMISEALKSVDHDIIILEEAFMKSFRTQVTTTLASTHPHTVHLPKDGYWKHVMDSGVFALSRYPIRMVAKDYYNVCTKTDCYSAKGVMLLEAELPYGKKLRIAATHLNAGQTQTSKDVRVTQVQQIIDTIASAHNEETSNIPVVVAGDLNINGHGDEFAPTLDALNMTSVPLQNPEVQSSGYNNPCIGKKGDDTKNKWVDHILLDAGSSGATVQNKRVREFSDNFNGAICALSDHQAVEATIHIP